MNSGDLLLNVLSARSELSWPAFKNALDVLAAKEFLRYDSAAAARNAVLRGLDSLGHCDFVYGDRGIRIFASPTCLVRLPVEQHIALLCGARVPFSVDRLGKVAEKHGGHVEVAEQRGGVGPVTPARVIVSGSDDNVFRVIAEEIGIQFLPSPPAWHLAQLSSTLDDIGENLVWQQVPELSWSKWDFDPEYVRFKPSGNDRATFRLTRYLDPKKNSFRYYLWKEGQCALIDPDWGRYIVLQKAGFHILYFDPATNMVALPSTVPLPRLLARAIGLCSGIAPRSLGGPKGELSMDFNVFELVPRAIAELVGSKVGQTLSECAFQINAGSTQ